MILDLIFSKFALLNLPNVKTPIGDNTLDNSIVWDNILPSGTTPDANNDAVFAESFQNYLLNHEELILESKGNLPYNNNIRQTVTERIFWKWLAKINAIKFAPATATEAIQREIPNRFIEQPEITDINENIIYNKVVQYIGDIDVMNNTDRYSEVYINIPTNHGKTPHILFKTVEDDNYANSMIWQGDNNNIHKRNSNDSPYGLSTLAYYDDNLNNTYKSHPGYLGNVENEEQKTVNNKNFKPSLMDGAVLDFNEANYAYIANISNEITSLNSFAASDISKDFKFNMILLYYTLGKVGEEEHKKTTNLFWCNNIR